ncbi:hypothetical protein D9M73_99480 [compost metagenome]
MPPLTHVEIRLQQVVDVEQQVFVECRRYAQRIVVSRLQRSPVLDQVNAQQQSACLALRRVGNVLQKLQSLVGMKVSEAGAGIEKDPIVLLHFFRQYQAA